MDASSALGRFYGHARCVACGEHNPRSLRVAFVADGAGGVQGFFPARADFEGYDGMLHGGVIATLLDAAMTHCLFYRGVAAVTADLRVRYVRPIRSDALLEIAARPVSQHGHLYRLRGEILVDDRIAAWAEAKFLPRP